ncbi:hypothetical protein ID866_2347 [Astraeus odoratus]|nr:hypothetical protein ID866_2347 [Astraeus odoratus]
MVYIASWQEYQEAAENLYAKSPNKVDLANSSCQAITDDTTCIKFKTYSSIYLNRFETLNLSLMQKMQNKHPEPTPAPVPIKSEVISEVTDLRAASPAPAHQVVPVAGGVKKKKPKKKK